jgi:lipoate-protein ligase B
VHHLGLIDYTAAWQRQNELAAAVAAGQAPASLLLLEHPPIFTFGRRGNPANLRWDAAECARRGVQVQWVDRGGDVTFHGPGQLVGYPILRLAEADWGQGDAPQIDTVGYVRRLEEVLQRAVLPWGVVGERVAGRTGVWVRLANGALAKLAAIGVKVDAHGVTRHGFALNVAPDMTYWDGIIGCGLADAQMVALAQLLAAPPTLADLETEISHAFGNVFGFQMV